MAVVAEQHHGLKPMVRSQKCRLPTFTQLDFFALSTSSNDVPPCLKNVDHTTSFHRSISTPCLSLTGKVEEESKESRKVELIGGKGASKVREVVVEVAIALAFGVNPEPISSGLGGAYLLHNRNGDKIAVAKPIDEEPLALNNPKGYTGRLLGQPGLKRSIRVGETGIRELAAYLLDHDGFSGVSPTALVRFSNVNFNVNDSSPVSSSRYKIASLQRYVEHDSDAGDLSPSGFSTSSVHRIGILDIRLLNIDRHSGNMLVGKYEKNKHCLGGAELIPIDHGLCLPEWLDDPYFEWLHWPQASIPFSDDEMEYISKLDPFEDAHLLRVQLPQLNESSIRVLVVCTIFLKRAASAGLCLADIGEMMTRECHGGEETMSDLDIICAKAKLAVSMPTKVIQCGDNRRENKGFEMFQLDEEFEEHDKEMSYQHKVVQTQTLTQQPYTVRQHDVIKSNPLKIEGNENHNLIKSISFATPGRKHEIEGISFGEMNEGEWDFFLEMFERLLPEVLDDRKSTGITQRVGSA